MKVLENILCTIKKCKLQKKFKRFGQANGNVTRVCSFQVFCKYLGNINTISTYRILENACKNFGAFMEINILESITSKVCLKNAGNCNTRW